jgi:hypothetical protein
MRPEADDRSADGIGDHGSLATGSEKIIIGYEAPIVMGIYREKVYYLAG